MTGENTFLEWKHVSEEDVHLLESALKPDALNNALEEIFNLSFHPADVRNVALSMHRRNYAFCKKQAFDYRRTSTFLSLMEEIYIQDRRLTSTEKTMETSYESFQNLLLRHSVDRPPRSMKVFERDDIESILDFAMDNYFRPYYAYAHLFGVQSSLMISQMSRNGVEDPANLFPLVSGIQMYEYPPPPPTAEELEAAEKEAAEAAAAAEKEAAEAAAAASKSKSGAKRK